jgi:hypothetical protein
MFEDVIGMERHLVNLVNGSAVVNPIIFAIPSSWSQISENHHISYPLSLSLVGENKWSSRSEQDLSGSGDQVVMSKCFGERDIVVCYLAGSCFV